MMMRCLSCAPLDTSHYWLAVNIFSPMDAEIVDKNLCLFNGNATGVVLHWTSILDWIQAKKNNLRKQQNLKKWIEKFGNFEQYGIVRGGPLFTQFAHDRLPHVNGGPLHALIGQRDLPIEKICALSHNHLSTSRHNARYSCNDDDTWLGPHHLPDNMHARHDNPHLRFDFRVVIFFNKKQRKVNR